ncbi:MAG: DUF1015 domain-containing protein [Bacteroidota bacterium]
MTKIAAFRALRPVRDKVHLIATRPYYSYKKNVLKAKLEDNPFTFLRIINPEFESIVKTKANSTERFRLVRDKYEEFITEGLLIQEESPRVYVYRQSKGGQVYTGFIAGASVKEYEDDAIKKHEATITSREEMFTKYLDIIGYNAEPVLLSYPPNKNLADLLESCTLARPEYEFSTTDKIKHELWVLDKQQTNDVIAGFEPLNAVYIADGHHRSASSVRLKNNRRANNAPHFFNEDFFLAFFISEEKMTILEFNRLVKTMNGHSKEELINLLKKSFEIKALRERKKPDNEHQFTLFLKDEWFELNCKKAIIDDSHPVKCLDSEILTQFVLNPLLDIKDLKSDERIEFVSGVESLENIEEKIRKGKYEMAFILFPTTIEQVKNVADHQLIMPPKSTWVEPKLRSGLTIYNINE